MTETVKFMVLVVPGHPRHRVCHFCHFCLKLVVTRPFTSHYFVNHLDHSGPNWSGMDKTTNNCHFTAWESVGLARSGKTLKTMI